MLDIASDASRMVRGSARSPRALAGVWLRAYGAIWAATLASTALVALSGTGARAWVSQLLGLRLDAGRNPAPSVAHVLALVAHNVPIAAWPLLLGVVGAHRHRLGRRVADTLLVACMIVNVLPVGAALGAYGLPLLPYLPQLPLEWAGLALGASAWLAQRKRALALSESLAVLAVLAVVLLAAGVLETVAVPHR
jgi:hypothetical protein